MAPNLRFPAIPIAVPERLRNRDAEYPDRQDSDFHYLTGFPEPGAVAVLISKPDITTRLNS